MVESVEVGAEGDDGGCLECHGLVEVCWRESLLDFGVDGDDDAVGLHSAGVGGSACGGEEFVECLLWYGVVGIFADGFVGDELLDGVHVGLVRDLCIGYKSR